MYSIRKIAAIAAALSLTACSAPTDSVSSQPLDSAASQTGGQTVEITESDSETSSGQTTSEQESSTTEQTDSTAEQETQEYNDAEYCGTLASVSAVTESGHRLEYTIDEESGCAYASVTYSTDYVPDSDLRNAVLSAQAENGVCWFGKSQGSTTADLTSAQSLTVKDVNGAGRTYSIITQRTEGLLPIVRITLDDGRQVSDISRTQHIEMSISIDCSNSPEYPSGLGEVSGKIRGRGNSTWKWEKKPYKIKLDEKAEVLGLAANKDWILLSNYADKSLMRDTVAYDMSRTLEHLGWVPTQYPVDLFINGEYQGVYSIGENMEVAKSRVNITEQSEGGECGYLLEVGGSDSDVDTEGVDYFHVDSDMMRYVTFKYPEPELMTDSRRAAIIDCFNAADNAIVSGGDIEEYIDVDSFCDWVIIQELTNNTDSAFRSRLRQRWTEVRERLLTAAMTSIDHYAEKIYPYQQENFSVWKLWDQKPGYSSWANYNANSYDLQVQYLKDFLTKRAAWIDENI